MLSFLAALLLFATSKLTASNGDSNAWVLTLGGGLMVLSGVGYLIFQHGNQARQPFINLWQRVSVTGYFDKEKYRIGDPILFQLRDRLTMTDKNLYRVHLQYVDEYEQRTGSGDAVKRTLIRHIRHHEFMDVTGVALYKGIRLSTNKPQQLQLKGNQLNKEFPKYWEVLVEEHEGLFYGRFFVNMR